MAINFSNVTAIALGVEDVLQIQDSLGTVLWQKVIYYNVSISAGSNGTVSVNGVSGDYSQSVPAGTVLTIEGTGTSGYDFDTWSDGNTNATRTVTITADTTLTASFVQQQPVGEPFYVEDASGNANTLSITTSDTHTPTFEVFSSTDGTNWTSMGTTAYGTPLTATVPANGKLYLKATTNRWGLWQTIEGAIYSSYNSIDCTGNYNIGGNVMSLLNGDNYSGATLDNNYDYQFYRLLYSSIHLVDASDLELPSNVTSNCYNQMFIVCTALTAAPALPATDLTGANSCYSNMFNGCTSLTTAPALPATTLAASCYYQMFKGCTALTTAPTLPATNLTGVQNCYASMFNGCSSLTTAPALPATTLGQGCYQYMFQNCTSLTTAPTLPATTMTEYCYYLMFDGCTSLTTVPASLPATTLANYCYQSMFRGCTALTQAPALPATTLAMDCYHYMFGGCTHLTSTPVLPATTLVQGCYWSMFNGCTSLDTVTTYANDISISSCTTDWLNNVAQTGDFYNYGSATYTSGASGIPQGWTEHKPYSVSISADSDGTVSVNGVSGDYSATVMSGTQLALVATPDSGFEFDIWSDGDINASRTITVTGNLTLTASFVQAVIPPDYFYIENVSDRNSSLRIIKNNVDAPTIEVFSSTDGTNWSSMGTTDKTSTSSITGVETPVAITTAIPANGKLYLKATTDQWGTIDPNTGDLYNSMNFGRNCNVGGNIMSLLYGDDFDEYPELDNNYYCQFMHLFHNNTHLVDASNLILPSNTNYGWLPDYCFYGMFSGCSSLTDAPELPALELGEGSYKEMFNGCTTLDTIVCYCEFNDMADCTDNWLNNVAATGDFYNYGGATYTVDSPSGIPVGWTEHTS